MDQIGISAVFYWRGCRQCLCIIDVDVIEEVEYKVSVCNHGYIFNVCIE